MSHSRQVRVAFLGCGAALEHLYLGPLKRLAGSGRVAVVGLVDTNEFRRRWAGSHFPSARVDSDVVGVLGDVRPDLTVITSPPPVHRGHAMAALAAGSHVLSEKPLADTLESAEAMVAGAAAASRLLAVAMPRRFYPCLREARQWIADGRLGLVQSYRYREGGVYAWPVASPAPFRRATAGGGVWLDKGVHVVDLMTWLFGPAKLNRFADDAWKGCVEASCMAEVTHGEVAGTIQLSWDQELNSGLTIVGAEGELFIPVGPLRDLFVRERRGRWRRIVPSGGWPESPDVGSALRQPRTYYECSELQFVQALRAVLHGERPLVPGEEGLATLRLLDEGYARAVPLLQEWLPEAEARWHQARHWRLGPS